MIPRLTSIVGIVTGVVILLLLAQIASLRHDLKEERHAHALTKASIATAQLAANVDQQDRVIVYKTQQKDISDASRSSYQRRIDTLDGELAAQRLRRPAQGAPAGSVTDSAELSEARAAAARADEAAAVCVADRAAIAIQLDELILWNYRQAELDPNLPVKGN